MKEKLQIFCHSSIKITEDKIIYFDPFNIKENFSDADYIFCTHSHYDHFSPEDINKVKNNNTKLIVTKDIIESATKLINKNNIILVQPNEEYKIDNLVIKTVPAYNRIKKFHPKENNWVGYIVETNGQKYYIAGDTDNIEELHNIKCDVAFLPVGGTYTMDYKQASELANVINAKLVIPTHYGSIVGDKEDAIKFKELVEGKEVKILMK